MDYIISCRARTGVAHAVLVFALAMSTIAIEGKAASFQRSPTALFGWEIIRQPAAASLRDLANSKFRSQRVMASESEARVVTVMEAPGFNTIYLELESSAHRFWIAAASTDVRIGNIVRFSDDQALAMENFESKALKRTFDKIYFVSAVTVAEIDP